MSKQTAGKRRKRIMIITGVLLLTLAAAIIIWLRGQVQPVSVSVDGVIRREVVHYVTATGKIEPETEVNLSPDVSGEIIELPVSEGDSVAKGDLLFKIQPDVYENQVEQNRARLNLSKSQSLEARSRKLKAEDDFRKAEMLYREQLISESDYLSAKTNAEASGAAYEASLYTIRQNQSLLDQSLEQLNKTIVRSPIEGVIISLESKLGERVVGTGQFPGTDVLRIANLDSMQVEVEVNENDIINVDQGDPVIVTVDAFSDRTFSGVVREISNSAITQAAGTQEEVTNFAVDIRILNHDRLLKPGMSATADIETERVQNALVVPIQSVTLRQASESEESREGVFVVQEKTARFREVETGTTDNTHIVIEEGLDEGEQVVSGSYSAITRLLDDGTPVEIDRE
ncbi:efflux RND transporter periplasmic adaptor subunit [Prosthecochloris sp. N3]|uniref:Efflux RND transporter periplasmic adaptor subunit n=1 Tax=Prosthecochloris ethylica TaxID=2743976 RepID=A0ABR9XQL7_9CHLB|nr:efflux RND transporter periplasmic adaptor subunit [Prosthecochloris ethylica]MBF0585488.1 efflux RND transporter periplasmic adaptor subunit [Prosthecochloris ethylica]MBF0636274.1 efflux RND transporter periplasmic adaptor subunit [Prosthecochloris ethylica]NUK46718.1 efflux RND transporter periplasmic adaptor subunit [Prosthecochloris ethylica]